jgi:lipopolysaccharide/colanic/teichoic acid biosynthesis glycosyltransferase
MELDNRYIDDISFWTDLKIIAKTPVAILFPKGGAY